MWPRCSNSSQSMRIFSRCQMERCWVFSLSFLLSWLKVGDHCLKKSYLCTWTHIDFQFAASKPALIVTVTMSFPCCLSALIGLSDQDLVQALSLFVNDILENLFVRAAFLFCSCTLMDEHTRCFNFTQTVFTRKQMRSVSQMCQFLPRNPANANVFVPK